VRSAPVRWYPNKETPVRSAFICQCSSAQRTHLPVRSALTYQCTHCPSAQRTHLPVHSAFICQCPSAQRTHLPMHRVPQCAAHSSASAQRIHLPVPKCAAHSPANAPSAPMCSALICQCPSAPVCSASVFPFTSWSHLFYSAKQINIAVTNMLKCLSHHYPTTKNLTCFAD